MATPKKKAKGGAGKGRKSVATPCDCNTICTGHGNGPVCCIDGGLVVADDVPTDGGPWFQVWRTDGTWTWGNAGGMELAHDPHGPHGPPVAPPPHPAPSVVPDRLPSGTSGPPAGGSA